VLLDAKASINAMDSSKQTALHAAAGLVMEDMALSSVEAYSKREALSIQRLNLSLYIFSRDMLWIQKLWRVRIGINYLCSGL